MTYGTPMHHCPDGPALTSDFSKRRCHASVTVTAHTYADLLYDELDHIATALDSLDDTSRQAGS
jgi:hypothetical protein